MEKTLRQSLVREWEPESKEVNDYRATESTDKRKAEKRKMKQKKEAATKSSKKTRRKTIRTRRRWH
jgi:hypothetical protein